MDDTVTVAATESVQLDVLIKKYLVDIQTRKNELRELQTMLKDATVNDADFQTLQTQATELSRKKKVIQDKILQMPALQEAKAKIEDAKDDIKRMNETLNGYLERYVTESGSRTIEDAKGEILEIVPAYRIQKPEKH